VGEAKEAYEAKYAETADENAAARAADEVFDKYAGPRAGAQTDSEGGANLDSTDTGGVSGT